MNYGKNYPIISKLPNLTKELAIKTNCSVCINIESWFFYSEESTNTLKPVKYQISYVPSIGEVNIFKFNSWPELLSHCKLVLKSGLEVSND